MADGRELSSDPTRLLTGEPERAWERFLAEHAALVLQVVHLFVRDPDEAEDAFLFACERLRRDDLRRLRRFRVEGSATFPTWLRAVVRRLCLDWLRHRNGRYRLPRSIARLPRLDREVFHCIRELGLSETETLHRLERDFPGLDRARLTESIERVERSLTGRQSWLLLTRSPAVQPLSGGRGGDASAEIELPDLRGGPEREAALREARAAMQGELARLPARARLLLRLRFEQDLPLAAIATVLDLQGPEAVERMLRGTLDRLRSALAERGFAGRSVEVG